MRKDQIIYQQMLKAIVEHQLAPGVRLPEDQLAETFQISRTGIRKILQRLALEKFVTIAPNKGAMVAKPSAEEAQQVLDSRILVEPLLIDEIHQHWNAETSKRMRLIVSQEGDAEDFAEMIQLSAEFHTELARLSGNEVMAEFVSQLTLRSSLVLAVFGSKHSVGCDCGLHEELINMFDQGDKLGAITWMKKHLEAIKSSLNFDIDKPKNIDFKSIFSSVG